MRMRALWVLAMTGLIVTALVAIGALIFGKFNETTGRILGTSGAVAGYSLLVMGGATAFAPGTPLFRRVLGGCAVASAAGVLVQVIAMIWIKSLQIEPLEKAAMIISVAAIGLAIAALLERLGIPARFGWAKVCTVALVLVFCAAIDVVFVALDVRSEALNRGIGVVGVLAALGILTLPIIAWRSAHGAQGARAAGASGETVQCPACGCRFTAGAA